MKSGRCLRLGFVGLALLAVSCRSGEPEGSAPPPSPDKAWDLPTLELHVAVRDGQLVGLRSFREREDRLSRATRTRTEILTAKSSDARLRRGSLCVVLQDGNARELCRFFVDDPFAAAIEAPTGLDELGHLDSEAQPMHWAPVDAPVSSFLLAVPDLGALRIVATRYEVDGREIVVGALDLPTPPADAPSPVGRQKGPLLATTDALLSAGEPPGRVVPQSYAASDAEYATVIHNGSSGDLVDFLILAEGFTDTNADRDAFNEGVQATLEHLWTIPTYYGLRACMNVHTAYLPSREAGSGTLHPKDTPFESYFDSGGRTIKQGPTGAQLALDVAGAAPGNYGNGGADAIAILVNDARHGGAGGFIVAFSSKASSAAILAHELGHRWIMLGDEYEEEYSTVQELQDGAADLARLMANVSGPVSSPAELKWIGFVDPATSIPTETDPGCQPSPPTAVRENTCQATTLPAGTVGMFEGAGYEPCGSFRPTKDCLMRCVDQDFCPVCDAEFWKTLGPFMPAVDVYLRDNPLDNGNVPSPTGVEHPPLSGVFVKPWHSVDVMVDAPPYSAPGTLVHENALAGRVNHVRVSVHNRGSDPFPAQTTVSLYVADATISPPKFPSTLWVPVGTQSVVVPGREGTTPVQFEWAAPVDAPAHSCLLVTLDSPGDPFPTLLPADLSKLVRRNNNITWKNLHVVQGAVLTIDFSSLKLAAASVVRLEFSDTPVGTLFVLSSADDLPFVVFDPDDVRQLSVHGTTARTLTFQRSVFGQRWFALQTLVGPGDLRALSAPLSLEIQLPPTVNARTQVFVSIDLLELNPLSGVVGAPISGNTYRMGL